MTATLMNLILFTLSVLALFRCLLVGDPRGPALAYIGVAGSLPKL